MATINGNNGDNYLVGTDNADTIYGKGGIDEIFGKGGNDTLDGGAGADFIDGGQGNDKIKGGGQDDYLVGGTGNDQLNGGTGNDILVGVWYSANSNLGKNEKDTLIGGDGADSFVIGMGSWDFYTGDGKNGYALIKDFDRLEGDVIGVGDLVSNFTIQNNYQFSGSNNNSAIFLGGDLVAIVQGNTTIQSSDLAIM